MTDTELRRIELLAQTRNSHKNYETTPLVHPRYGLGQQSSEYSQKKTNGSFSLRLTLALFLFVVYAMISYKEYSIGDLDSQDIVEAVSLDIELER